MADKRFGSAGDALEELSRALETLARRSFDSDHVAERDQLLKPGVE